MELFQVVMTSLAPHTVMKIDIATMAISASASKKRCQNAGISFTKNDTFMWKRSR